MNLLLFNKSSHQKLLPLGLVVLLNKPAPLAIQHGVGLIVTSQGFAISRAKHFVTRNDGEKVTRLTCDSGYNHWSVITMIKKITFLVVIVPYLWYSAVGKTQKDDPVLRKSIRWMRRLEQWLMQISWLMIESIIVFRVARAKVTLFALLRREQKIVFIVSNR